MMRSPLNFQYIIAVIVVLLWSDVSLGENVSSKNKKGISAYNRHDYQSSAKHFTDALIEKPDSPDLRYNLGTALSDLGKKDDALHELSQSAQRTSNPTLSSSAHFNAGNTLFGTNDFKGAVNEYKQALKFDQSSKDIRHNLELAMRKLQEQQQNQKNQSSDTKNKDKQDSQSNDKKSKSQESKPNEKQQNKQEAETSQQQDKQQPQQQESTSQFMNPEEAQRILQALNDEEKKALSLRKEKMRHEMRQGDDW
jgi:Ca-activated chloride channel homolog